MSITARIEQRVRTTLALSSDGLYKKILVLVPDIHIQELVYRAFEWHVKHTKIVAYRREMKFVVPLLVATKPDGIIYIAMPNFEKLRGREWDMCIEFGYIVYGSTESIYALYTSVRCGDDPLIIKWRD